MSKELPSVFFILINSPCESETNRGSFDIGLTAFFFPFDGS